MKSVRRLEADSLLDGRPADPASPWREVSDFLDNARLEAAAMPAPPPRPALAAILEGRRPVPTAPTTRGVVTFPRVSTRLRPVAALVAAGAVTFGGLATAGALPGPLQRASAALGSRLGIQLPRASSTPDAPRPSTLAAAPTTSGATTTAIARTPSGRSGSAARPETPSTRRSPTNGTRPGVNLPTTVPARPDVPTLPVIPPLPTLLGPIGPTGRLPLDALKEPRPTFRHSQPAP